MKNYRKFMVALCVIIILCSMAMALIGCEKEEEIPWWKDKSNIEVIFEDERTVEKVQYSSIKNIDKLNFTYYIDSQTTKEYIPNMRLTYKGEDQDVIIHYYKKYYYEYDYIKQEYIMDKPLPLGKVGEPGRYLVIVEFYRDPKDLEHYDNCIYQEYIYIDVNWQE